MNTLLSYPIKEVSIIQPFGANPDYYAKFGWKGHNGIDFRATHATPVYAAHDGIAYYVGPDPHGGDGVYVRSTDCTFNTIYWHLIAQGDPEFAPKVPPTGFYPVRQGDLLGYSDNTGAPFESSGDHCHFAYMPIHPQSFLPLHADNGFGGCEDPAPFLPPPQAVVANIAEEAIMAATKSLSEIANGSQPVSVKIELLNELKAVIQNIESKI